MFMRYRGGGIGHLYMREIEQQLNLSRWGSSWPSSLRGRDPNPDQEPSPQNDSNAAAGSASNGGYKSDSTEEDIGDDSDSNVSSIGSDGELADEDSDGEDLEYAGEDEDKDEDEDEDISQTQIHLMDRIRRTKRTTEGSNEDEVEEPEEGLDDNAEDLEDEEEDPREEVEGV